MIGLPVTRYAHCLHSMDLVGLTGIVYSLINAISFRSVSSIKWCSKTSEDKLESRRKVFDHANFVCPKRHGIIVIHEDWSSKNVIHVSTKHQLTKLPQTASRFHSHVFRSWLKGKYRPLVVIQLVIEPYQVDCHVQRCSINQEPFQFIHRLWSNVHWALHHHAAKAYKFLHR